LPTRAVPPFGAAARILAMLDLGAPAIGISDDGGQIQYVLSPTSYQVIGMQGSSPGAAQAIVVAAEVAAPGDV
jgi:hypothetical protein